MPRLRRLVGIYKEDQMSSEMYNFISKELPHGAVTATTNVLARGNPYVFAATLAGHGLYHLLESRGGGGPTGTSPTSTVSSYRRQGRASAEPGKRGRTPSLGKESRARRKECPKGHYWSYKFKKCVKSKYR